MNGERFLDVPDTQDHAPFIAGLTSCPKYGLHNPMRNQDRYVMLGAVCAKAAACLATPQSKNFLCASCSGSCPRVLRRVAARLS